MKKRKQKVFVKGVSNVGNRNYEIKIKLSKEEKEKLQSRSELHGLKLSTYIRMCSLHKSVNINSPEIIVL